MDDTLSRTLPRTPGSTTRRIMTRLAQPLPSPLSMSPMRLKVAAAKHGAGAPELQGQAPFRPAPLMAKRLVIADKLRGHEDHEVVVHGSRDDYDWETAGAQFVLATSPTGQEATDLARQRSDVLVRVNARIADPQALKGAAPPPTVATKPRRRRASLSQFLAREYVSRKYIQKYDASEQIMAELRKGA